MNSCLRSTYLGYRHIAYIKATILARFDQTLGYQAVIRPHHGGRAHALLLRAQAHRRQTRAGRQQPVANTLGKARRELLRQGLGGGLQQHGVSLARSAVTPVRSRGIGEGVDIRQVRFQVVMVQLQDRGHIDGQGFSLRFPAGWVSRFQRPLGLREGTRL